MLPVYVYDCPLSDVIQFLTSQVMVLNRKPDVFLDLTYKFDSELGEDVVQLKEEEEESKDTKMKSNKDKSPPESKFGLIV